MNSYIVELNLVRDGCKNTIVIDGLSEIDVKKIDAGICNDIYDHVIVPIANEYPLVVMKEHLKGFTKLKV